MWFSLLYILLIVATVHCGKYDNVAKEVLSLFNAVLDNPSEDLGKLRRFKEDLSEFSRKLVPLAESFAQSLEKNETFDAHIVNITNHIKEGRNIPRLPYGYDHNVKFLMKLTLDRIEQTTRFRQSDFKEYCFQTHGKHELAMDTFVGKSCLETRFSANTASILFELIDSFKYMNYTLISKYSWEPDKRDSFRRLYSALYFYLARQKDISIAQIKIRQFIREKKDFRYENKLKMLEEVIPLFGIRNRRLPTSKCFPLALFVESEFNRTFLLKVADIIMSDIYAVKFVTHMCANFTSYGFPGGAELYVSSADKILTPVYSVLTNWFDALLESTWPATETELIGQIMKEAAGGRDTEENTVEYQRIAGTVHNKMSSIGHPSYTRHYLTSNEYSSDSSDFDYKCWNNTCSRAVSSGVQCITLRIPKAKIGNETVEYEKFANFSEIINSAIMEVLEKGTVVAPQVARHLESSHNISLTNFANHSSYILLHNSEMIGNCNVSYGLSSEESPETSIRLMYYHKSSFFSKCHDWLLLLGL